MRMNSIRRNPRQGSALLASLIVIVLLTFAAAAVLSYSLTTYRNSKRQALLDQAKEYADSEMEYLYFNWKTQLLLKVPEASIEAALISSGVTGSSMAQTESPFSATELAPAAPATAPGWNVSRMLTFNPISGTSDG